MTGAHSNNDEASITTGVEATPVTDVSGGDARSPSANLPVERKSALQENIERKGKHAYYFAHAHKATGPEWDGNIAPKLLSLSSLQEGLQTSPASFEYHKSNITSYAFSDEGKTVKLYITLEDVGEKCVEGDITLDYTAQSFCLLVRNYDAECKCLSFGKLSDRISAATYKLKKDKVIVILTKEKDGEWHTINDKGTP
eukprot:CAMPEP_0170280134 /NCGR_PEP_ID=MMETSP0116_2-20130129/40078_1 /TAXON_ID=400756 /ORGANISM="Durinskia baltica, Strain CSIRO CS-38" /LENGTH=197 /DNA_ID=CAMNT_0010531459 /DNA_START=29 /DNA_END=619 /DNA_ORIENTATION=+